MRKHLLSIYKVAYLLWKSSSHNEALLENTKKRIHIFSSKDTQVIYVNDEMYCMNMYETRSEHGDKFHLFDTHSRIKFLKRRKIYILTKEVNAHFFLEFKAKNISARKRPTFGGTL